MKAQTPKRGRPAIHGVRKVVVSIRLTPKSLAWLKKRGNVSEAVEKLVMEKSGASSAPTKAD